jgi:hypothetical protein
MSDALAVMLTFSTRPGGVASIVADAFAGGLRAVHEIARSDAVYLAPTTIHCDVTDSVVAWADTKALV